MSQKHRETLPMPLHADQSPIAQFKTPKLQWVWSRRSIPRASWRLIFLGFYFRENPRRLHLAIAVKAVSVAAVLLAIAGYLAVSGAVYATWSRSPHNRVAYTDLLLPFRWSEARALRGGDLVAEGLGELKRKRYATAILLLSKGVSLNPAEQRGRLELAKLFMQLGYLHRAKQFLEDGLAHPPITKTYYDLYFVLAAYMEDHEAVLAAAAKLESEAGPAARRDLIGHRARALLALGKFEELDALREAMKEAPLVSVHVAWARSTIARGRAELALAAMAADPLLFGLIDERRELEGRLALAARDFARAQQLLAEWLQDRPVDAGPRRLAVLLATARNDVAVRRTALDQYFLFFGSNPSEIAQLFVRLDEIGDESALQACRALAVEFGVFHPLARMAYVESLLTRGLFSEAETELEAAQATMAAENFFAGSWPEGMRRILDACVKPVVSTQSLLIDFLTNERASPAGFHLALNALAQSRATEALRDIYTLGKLRYPGLAPRAATREKIELAQNAQRRPGVQLKSDTARTPASVSPRTQVANDTTQTARREQATAAKTKTPLPVRKETPPPLTERAAKALLTRAQEQAESGRFSDALATLEALARPEAAALLKEVLLLQARCHAELRNYDTLKATMWLLLRERPVNLPELRRMTEQARARGNRDSALIIARETVAAVPEAKWAAQLLRELESELKTEPAGAGN